MFKLPAHRFARLAVTVSLLSTSAAAFAALGWTRPEPVRAELSFEHEPFLTSKAPVFANVQALAKSGTAQQTVRASEHAVAGVEANRAMPDVVGMKLNSARKALRALGVKVVARDAFGGRVEPDFAHFYRVKKQDIEAGAKLEAGTTVQLKVRELYSVASGY